MLALNNTVPVFRSGVGGATVHGALLFIVPHPDMISMFATDPCDEWVIQDMTGQNAVKPPALVSHKRSPCRGLPGIDHRGADGKNHDRYWDTLETKCRRGGKESDTDFTTTWN